MCWCGSHARFRTELTGPPPLRGFMGVTEPASTRLGAAAPLSRPQPRTVLPVPRSAQCWTLRGFPQRDGGWSDTGGHCCRNTTRPGTHVDTYLLLLVAALPGPTRPRPAPRSVLPCPGEAAQGRRLVTAAVSRHCLQVLVTWCRSVVTSSLMSLQP